MAGNYTRKRKVVPSLHGTWRGSRMGASENVPAARGRMKQTDGTVRVWSEVGLTVPVGDTTAHIRFLFGHERIAKNDTQEEIKRTEKLIDEFNEAVVEAKVRKYT